MADMAKPDFLRKLGYADHHEELNHALAEAGLTRLDKPRIHLDKRERAAALLEGLFLRVCRRGDCLLAAPALAGQRTLTGAATPDACQLCGGQALARARERMAQACARAGWSRLCILGGSPNSRVEISRSLPESLEARLVDGTATHSLKEARDDLEWAHHVVIWAGTQLDHKVSTLYLGAASRSSLARRSVQELFAHIADAAERRRQDEGGGT